MSDENPQQPRNYKVFMVWIHIISISVYPLTRSRFWLSFYSDKPIMYYWVIFIFGVSFSCYRHCIHNPGFITPEDDPENPPDNENNNENNNNSVVCNIKKSKYFYCTHCKQYVPLRASHCKKCQRCIMRRDHHCPFTDQCIGRDNHSVFLLWCYCESLLMGTVAFDTIISLFHYSKYTKISQQFYYSNILNYSTKWEIFMDYLKIYGSNLFLAPFMIFDAFQVFILSFTHTLMAIYNITTWEQLRKPTISYFEGYPSTQNPFDKGKINNLIEFVHMKRDKIDWNHPAPPKLTDFVAEYNVFGTQIMNSLVGLFA